MIYALNLSKYRNDGILYIGSHDDCIQYLTQRTKMGFEVVETVTQNDRLYRETLRMDDATEYYVFDVASRIKGKITLTEDLYDHCHYQAILEPEHAMYHSIFLNRLYKPELMYTHHLSERFAQCGLVAPVYKAETLYKALVMYAENFGTKDEDRIKAAAKALLWGMITEAGILLRDGAPLDGDALEIARFFGF